MPRKVIFSKKFVAVFFIGQLAAGWSWAVTNLGGPAVYIVDGGTTRANIANGAVFDQPVGTLQVGNGVNTGTVSNSGAAGIPAGSASNASTSSTINVVNSNSSIMTTDGSNVIDFNTVPPTAPCTLTINNTGTIANQNPAGTNAPTGNAILGDSTQGYTSLNLTNNVGAAIVGVINMGNSAHPNTITNSGTIDGAITLSNQGDTITNNGGAIIGNVSLGTGGTVNLTNNGRSVPYVIGNISQTGANNGTLNVGANGGAGIANFSTNGTINTATINVHNNGTTFNVNNAVTGVATSLTVANSAVIKVGSGGDISGGGNIVNNGTFVVSGTGTIGASQHMAAVTNTGNMVLSGGNVATGAVTNAGGNFTVTSGVVNIAGNFTNGADGAVNIQNSTTTITGAYNSNTNTSVHMASVVGGAAQQLNIVGAADLSNSTVKIASYGGTVLSNGQILNIISGTAPPNLNGTVVSGLLPSPALSYAIAANGNDVQVTVTRQPVTSSTAQSMVKVIDKGIMNNQFSSGAIKIFNLINQQPTVDAMSKAYAQLYPDVNGRQGLQTVSLGAKTMAVAAAAERVEHIARRELDTSDVNTGYSAGSMKYDKHMWIRGLGNTMRQKERQGFLGYNAHTGGFAFGSDNHVDYNTLVGIGLSYASSSIKTKDVPPNKTKIKSYQATFYTSYSPKKYYIDGFLAFALNKYKTERNIAFANMIATGDFNGIQPSIKIVSGYVHAINNFKIIPNVSLEYTFLHQAKYNEDGAGDVNLSQVSNKDLQKIEGGLGIKFAFLHKEKHHLFNPDLHFMILRDFNNVNQETTAQFTGGAGGNFTIQGVQPAKTTYNVGFGITYTFKERFYLTLNYDLSKKEQFIGNSGMLTAKWLI